MAETPLQAPPPGRPSEESDGSVRLAACRSCSDRFTYISSTGLAVDIVVGIPAPGGKYKAISHVWGPPFVVHMVCQQCLADHSIRIRSRSTFDNVMMLAGPGGTIWMDTMSINQEDHADIAAQVAVMGEIYGNAERVSVLLPESDTEVFDILAELLPMATTLLSRKGQFDYNLADDEWGVDGPLSITETGRIANRFLELIDTFQSKLAETTYWTRAWTFQEWARAHEIEVALDLPGDGRRPVLQKVKSSILYVAIMVIDYAIRKDEYGLMEIDLFRGLAGPKLDQVKRLFPFEDAFATPDEILGHEVLCQTLHPNHMGTNAILGLRGNPRRPRTAEEQFKARVRLMLDAFAGMHRRHATFEADLVCCWASMCNISYDYSKDDPLPVAVAKVSRALRERGLRLYNFTSNRHREQDVDMAFFEYAAAHVQHNATNKAPFPDAPIFSGQADTLKHFATSLAFCHRPHEDIPHAECGDVRIQRVVGAVFAMVTSLSNTARLLPWLLRVTSSGGPDGDCHLFTGLSASIETLIKSLPEEAAKDSKFLVAAVPVSPEHRRKYLHLWAICPKSVLEDEGTLYIGREGLNGTLVVAKESTPDTIVAYLTISDRRCGTFLAESKYFSGLR
ncbi:hypothetical protein NEMBOFW57_008991 [Staphylotrichum longicolle]|uniref:Heterokaryon incompatibility domain-containing protein n=1 Tax=Staphylotrichum longicolle TaxID=669026 RepID=A0AAD4HXT6_9PEZI|nr:hypothetical protein NEMBOFW57_008991 [Staphylotrichum longicolle]